MQPSAIRLDIEGASGLRLTTIGRLLQQRSMSPTAQATLSTQQLAAGIYLLRWHYANGKTTQQRFIRE